MNYLGHYEENEVPEDPLECVLDLRTNLCSLTTEGGSHEAYRIARERLMANPVTRDQLPRFIRQSRDATTAQSALKMVSSGPGSWANRRQHVVDGLQPLIDFLESGGAAADAAITEGLESYDGPAVQMAWTRALERRHTDPEAAITSARTLLEEVCKHIIEDAGQELNDKWDMPKLYNEAATTLNLAPSQHTEEAFKRILGGCQTVVQGLGELRNKASDAHGGGRRRVKPKARHATLAVNLAGGMALFLIETANENSERG